MEVIEIHQPELIHGQLTELLQNCVSDGASIGFLPPLSTEEASAYWLGVAAELGENRKLWVAKQGRQIIGTVQLSLCGKRNGSHRAEVEKLMVHTQARGQGAGRALMGAAEAQCAALNRTLLVLDTREGDVASELYKKLDYVEAGRIPEFARSASGTLAATIYFYKQIEAS
ncbi:GNAT family N-acetyltransferase [Photobacterium sp. 1_MG-2023]|uniref:GNAT family N-acetyltransferase n=1 Tax=Photobacterium sp. 1_MG-2023 TaxID=3062646 RepID=UPI0026E120F5|nr:GNAT family N-acetyltransferase [Photobacterium sp. 1_MG-2023]MDO6706836.1 GNAT family N-acetyltransferase [Photobacterium sp. 1_MG-2023]